MSRARRADAETAELALRRLEALRHPRRALDRADAASQSLELADWDLDDELDDELDEGPASELGPEPDRGQGPPGRRHVPGLVVRARTFTRGHLGVVLAIAVVALLVAAAGVARARPLTVSEPTPVSVTAAPGSGRSSASAGASSSSGESSAATSPEAKPALVVHVVGSVRRPGVVRLPDGARVTDAIAAAGGLTSGAAPGELNLAQPVLDGQQVVIVSRAATRRDPPAQSEVRDPGSTSAGTSSGTSAGGTSSRASPSGGKVNLNTATADQLDALSGVGPVTAQRILDWRSEHGRFSRIEELQEVDGIGPKTFAELASQVTV